MSSHPRFHLTPALALTAVALLLLPGFTKAMDNGWAFGLRGIVLLGDGVPANDMLGGGLLVRKHWRDQWYVGLGLDSITFDYERPNAVLDIPSTQEIDGSFDISRVSAWVERRYDDKDRGWSWFWTAGLGYADIATENVMGQTPDGEMWNIKTDASGEVHLMLSAGIRRHLRPDLTLDISAHIEHHATDYELMDTVSGATGKIGSQTPKGFSLGFSYHF